MFANDHASAIEKILINPRSRGNKFNISGNNQISNINLVKIICDLLDKKIKNKPRNIKSFKNLISYIKDRPGHDKRYFLNSYKINKFYNWSPETRINDGLEITLSWYLSNKEWWKN